jgi:RNA 3'-terminal phosphate cyclase (GTP)
MFEIPGDKYEGGGQILRTAIALSCFTQKPFHIYNIRGKRPNPGLRPQHLKGFQVAKLLTDAKVEGLEIGSKEVKFIPQGFKAFDLDIDIKTAGSIGLLLQSILLPISALSRKEIKLRIKGGTHVKGAVPIDYYINVIIPILNYMGVKIKMNLINHGYYPRGGGIVDLIISPWEEKIPLKLIKRGNLVKIRGVSHASQLLRKARVAERQRDSAFNILKKNLNLFSQIETKYFNTFSLGSGIVIWAEFDDGSILGADALGKKGKPAEEVGKEAGIKLIEEINSNACVDKHLADNLIPWLAIAGGEILASEITLHTETNIWITEMFIERKVKIKDSIISF